MKVVALFLGLTAAAIVESRSWLPSMGDGMTSACFNQYHGGGTVLAQCGGPTTTQVANNPDESGNSKVTEFVAITDHSIQLLDHAGTEHPWASHFSGFGTTNWGGGDEETLLEDAKNRFSAQAYTSYVGSNGNVWDNGCTHDCGPKSSLNLGYTSYFMQDAASLGYNQFFIGSPSGVNYYLPGCPNFKTGQTSESQNGECPRVDIEDGTFKFTILGLLTGTMVNSLNTAYPPAAGTIDGSENVERDIAQYTKLLYRSTLDLGAMGGTLGNYTTEVVGGVHDGKSFDELTSSDNLAGAKLRITGSKDGPVDLSFSDTYSTGSFTRSKADLLEEFGGCQESSGNVMDACTRDITGFKSGTDSLPADANKAVSKIGNAEMSWSELGSLAGAPELKVTEVRNMTITLRKSLGCVDRPDTPAARDPSGTGVSWPGNTGDCPWWYMATDHNTPASWVLGKGSGATHGVSGLIPEDYTLCEPGSCWLIDFHIELGGQTEASRTVFGNPENDVNEGWERGTFFMYDPEVVGNGPELKEFPWRWVILAVVATGIPLCCACCCLCCRRRMRAKRKKKDEMVGVGPHENL